ncbi:shikimate kinase [Devosia aquimaris]|uniref:shikimate kinase n=1 Tax=Devosia aquimaris TaxID=2866214 RepID=UPI001CD0D91C|nr:shikimate kinase [Devosia sp. CJK-A8-3]
MGKSTLGRALAQQLGWPLLDLDLEFCARIAVIGDYIAAHGYGAYRAANLALAQEMAAKPVGPQVFVTPSGFLAAAPETEDYQQARALIWGGYGMVLLPSLDIDLACRIVVARQLTRGFGFEAESESEKFRTRFARYRAEGDALVLSTAAPGAMAAAVIAATGLGKT